MSDGYKPDNKPGRWTNEQLEFMKQNVGKLTPEEIALHVEKNVITVKKYLKEKLGFTEEQKAAIVAKFDIKKSAIWPEIKKQLDEDELDVFMHHWCNLMAQFKNEVLSTERMQMVELCRMEILLNRNMCLLKDSDSTLKKVTQQLNDEQAKPKEKREEALIARLQQMIASLNIARPSLSKEFQELVVKKNNILKELKATRADRLRKMEDSKQSLSSWVIAILEDDELRRNIGIEMKKQAHAMLVEQKRLADYHTFIDGTVERPITNADTVDEND